jgi:23S rRNA (uracil1939-C5)-methyltransferase
LKISRKKIGYYRERSHEIIEILHCPIADPLINRILDSLREALSSLSLLWKSEEVEINVSPHEEKGVLLVHLPSVQKKEREMATALLRRHPFLKGILLKTRRDRFSCGDPFLIYNVSLSLSGKQEELRFRVSPGSFSQIHTEQNQALIETVIDLSRVHQDERVLDLYSGIGNFTLPLALLSRKAIGVEEDNTAVQDACWNARLNRIDRVTFLHRRVKEGLVHWEGDKPDLVLLDPPRTGAADAVSPITELGPKRIVYVSCDPPTLARDLRLFSEKGYSLRAVSLIDMFPQTYHMEVAALLAPDAEPERG